ncbi:hypothetical protein E4U42_001522 [Claviceps africana]|uniref:TDP1 Tyr-DNA phosphodiesterase n=1 Tax=Claviceps africana TaxID=83212 RepID=A0A8K0J9S5_9HYPO|nr:hypothetical protein E4U42_001522 [Claviceps africana]
MSTFGKRQRPDEIDKHQLPTSLSTPISPPRKSRRLDAGHHKSPWQLTWVRDLPEELNRDAVTLSDILGDPLISECWEFNFLHDVGFLMDAFDPDTRHLVDVHVVHGFWKRDDPQRRALSLSASAYNNVKLHVAPMPEMFGTHHSKMLVLFRHDDTAEVIVHTANMIPKDWTNMTNAVWRSPRLPRSAKEIPTSSASTPYEDLGIGSGHRFQADLISYLRSYDRRAVTCGPLADRLSRYDFSAVRAALITSVPGVHDVNDVSCTPFGWAAMRRYLGAVPCEQGSSEVVIQISSIATLGGKDTWLQKTLLDSFVSSRTRSTTRPKFKIVFPTADEIRRSLDGYASGGSIHTRIQSAQQMQQLHYLRPILYHWANDCDDGAALPRDVAVQNGGRKRAAPHVKTYIRYNENRTLDWAVLTSANLSKQAWGEAAKPTGEMRIASWEMGVLIWPELLEENASMVASFPSDSLGQLNLPAEADAASVALRIPYSLPLQRPLGCFDGSYGTGLSRSVVGRVSTSEKGKMKMKKGKMKKAAEKRNREDMYKRHRQQNIMGVPGPNTAVMNKVNIKSRAHVVTHGRRAEISTTDNAAPCHVDFMAA